MELVIFAGGLGTRISEETDYVPKPMVKIGKKPILWHIIKYYSVFGFSKFIICGGYKVNIIKDYFKNLKKKNNTFNIRIINTGKKSNTGERLRRIKKYVSETFCLTYGDGLSNVNLTKLIDFHKKNKSIVTLTAVKPTPHFGKLIFKGHKVAKFLEKNQNKENWINGGFFVCQPEVFNYILDDNTIFEKDPMEALAHEGMMQAYLHNGFWKPMDTLRDKVELEQYWDSGKALWKKW